MARILIVDDKEQDRYLLQVLLEKSGYEITAAGDGHQALKAARATPPDMIVSDILMPGMDGFNLCREWLKDPKLRDIPFVFYTATYTDPRDEEFALSLGADRFIVKPVDPESLLNSLNEVLAQGRDMKAVKKGVTQKEEGEGYFKKYSEALVRKLEDKLELFRAVFDADPGIILVLSESCTVSEINRAAQDLLGVSPDEVLDKPFVNRFVAEPYRDAFTRRVSDALAGRSVRNFECDIIVRGNSTRTIIWNAERLKRSSGVVEEVLVIGVDISLQRETERQLRHAQKMEALGTFAAGIAHDFNNILAGVIGFVDIALHASAKDGEIAEDLRKVLLAAKRASNLSGQILAFSRRSEQQREPVDVAGVVSEAIKLVRAAIPTIIDIELQSEGPCGLVQGFPVEIHQIVVNLCTNAFHAIGTGAGKISIACYATILAEDDHLVKPVLPTGQYVVLEVRDTGSGMTEETMAQIFDPYFTTKEAGKGTGLGLAVVRSIVEMHGGGIAVESELGKGSTFRVYFPRMITTYKEVSAEAVDEEAPHGTERILLVEDEATNRTMFTLMLQSLGYVVTSASNGAEALEMYEQTPRVFDCLVTDLTMPKMSGTELAKKIREINEELPIVIMSGSVITGEDLGIPGDVVVAAKPILRHEFAKAVRKALDMAR